MKVFGRLLCGLKKEKKRENQNKKVREKPQNSDHCWQSLSQPLIFPLEGENALFARIF